ncbi:acyl-CoA carboxylase epsilon subunit [Streptomyces sp. NPDC005012]|uniref:acyl-CoA carboxylase epsilon subunit n=1 Tax=unclassified Streptomyces TaxID=2593676 RepID=UPI0033AD5735
MTIKVVRGNPTPEELAAALAVVRARAAAVAAGSEEDAGAVRDAWGDPAVLAGRRTPRPGPAAWSRTYWPV